MGSNYNPNRPQVGYGQGPYGQMPYGGGTPAEAPVFNPGPGFVRPFDTLSELNDLILNRFLQQLVAGVTGIIQTMVRPRWQPEPPNQPNFDKDWAAVGRVKRDRDTFAAVLHFTDPQDFDNSTDSMYRNEIVDILCSFYGPGSEANSELLAMGLMLEQNRYAIQLNGFGLVEVGETLTVPAIIKEKWLMGQDVPFRLRRQQIYSYPSPNLVEAQASLIFDNGMKPVPIVAKK